jgi:hypothetical protein
LFPKCAKTHLRAYAIHKIFPTVFPPDPVKERREEILEGRSERDRWGGIDIREGAGMGSLRTVLVLVLEDTLRTKFGGLGLELVWPWP